MNLPASACDPLRRHRSFGDPLAYYHEHYAGLTRYQLSQRDQSLYHRLRRDGLLWQVPDIRTRFGGDPLAYYRKHYAGLTRGQLKLRDRRLYDFLVRKGLLGKIARNTATLPTRSPITASTTRDLQPASSGSATAISTSA